MYALFKRPPAEWRAFFMDLAERVALLSKDPRRKVGAVLVTQDRRQLSFGYNGLPAGIPDTPAHLEDRQFKLAHTVHAEDNCIGQAPFSTVGCSLYLTRFPCQKCAQKIADAGVAEVVAPIPDLSHPRWGVSWREATNLLARYRIKMVYVTPNTFVSVSHKEVSDE
jgi:dCMP deaminase